MKASLLTKLDVLADRHQEVEALLGNAEVINDQNRFRELSVEFAHLNDVVAQYQRWQQLQAELEGVRAQVSHEDARNRSSYLAGQDPVKISPRGEWEVDDEGAGEAVWESPRGGGGGGGGTLHVSRK